MLVFAKFVLVSVWVILIFLIGVLVGMFISK